MASQSEVGARPPSTPGITGPEDALDHLLAQVITGFFVLTDGQGNLSKWSEPAEFLFGLAPDEALGEPMFGKLMAPPLSPEGQAWQAFLEQDVPPVARARAPLNARHPEAGEFAVEAVFVPVKLDEGFDFSLFLEDLSFELPMDLMLVRMRQQHPVVVKALRQALAEEPIRWDGGRTAGTLVIFSPQVETPWIDAAMEKRASERAAADEEAKSRIQAYEVPAVHGEGINDLEDAAAVVERLRWATERIEELEVRSRIAEGAAFEVAEARKRAEAAEQAALEARAQLTDALTKADAELVATSEAERLELLARLDRIERATGEAAEAAASHRLADERERQRALDIERATLDLGKRLEGLQRDVAGAESERVAVAERARAEAQAAVEAATQELRARMEAVEHAHGDEAASRDAEARAEAARAELHTRMQALERQQADEWKALREEVVDLRVAAADAAELRAQLQRVESAVSDTARWRAELAETREEIEALRRSGAGPDAEERIGRLEGHATEVAALRDDLERLRAAAALSEDVEALREAASGASPGQADLERLREAIDAAGALREEIDGLKARAEAVEPVREELRLAVERLEELSTQTAALRADVDAGAGRRNSGDPDDDRRRLDAAERDVEQARAAVEALQAEVGELHARDADARHDLEGLQQGQEELRGFLEEARRDRDEARERLEDALRQVEEAKALAARRAAEDAARAAGASESETRRRLDRAAVEFESVQREAEAIRTRLVELSTTAQAAERRAEEAASAAAAVRSDAAEARDEARAGRRIAEEAADRIDAVDRGASKVLSEVRAQHDAVQAADELAREAAQTAGEAQARAAEAWTAAERAGRVSEDVDTLRSDLEAARRELEERLAYDPAVALQAVEAELSARLEELDGHVEDLRNRPAATPDAAPAQSVAALHEALDALRRDVESRPGSSELEALRGQIGSLPSRQDVDALRADLDARPTADDVAAVRQNVASLAERLDEDAGEATAQAVQALQADVEALREDRAAAGDLAALGARLADVEAQEPADVDALAERLDAATAKLSDLAAEVAEARGASAMVHGLVETRLAEAAAEVMAARTETESVRRAVDDLRHEMQAIREYAATAKAEGSSALQVASTVQAAGAETDRKVEELRSELSDSRRMLEELRIHAEDARRAAQTAKAAAERAATAEKGTSERFTEVWDELIKKSRDPAANRTNGARPDEPKPPAREPREGFDDQDRAMAVIGLDGKFKELNLPFTKLIGYEEHEFTRAAWPSVHDRTIYKQQLAAFAEMVAGERDSLEVQSTFMHGQGLMVPVHGRLELVRDESGAPAHMLLVADDRPHA